MTSEQVDTAFGEERALLYKHSTRCPISAAAHEQVEAFARQNPDVPIYIVDVIDDRPISRYVGERANVEHHSPQAILLADGKPVWNASHYEITARELARAWEDAAD